MDDEITPPRKHYKLRTDERFQRVNPGPSTAENNEPIDVYQMRADQQAIEHQAGTDELKPIGKSPSRRRRDFLTLLVANNALFGSLIYFGQDNPFLMGTGLAGMTIGSVGSYWVIYQIMGKY